MTEPLPARRGRSNALVRLWKQHQHKAWFRLGLIAVVIFGGTAVVNGVNALRISSSPDYDLGVASGRSQAAIYAAATSEPQTERRIHFACVDSAGRASNIDAFVAGCEKGYVEALPPSLRP